MARVTVEDCLAYVENRFDLVLKASTRAHALQRGDAQPQVPVDNDKPTVIALREIAANLLQSENKFSPEEAVFLEESDSFSAEASLEPAVISPPSESPLEESL